MNEKLDLKITRGNPTAEELAALVVALTLKLNAARDADAARPISGWARNARRFRRVPDLRPATWHRPEAQIR